MLPGVSRHISALLVDQLPAPVAAALRDARGAQQLVKLCADCRDFHDVCIKFVTSSLPHSRHHDNSGEFACFVCPSVSSQHSTLLRPKLTQNCTFY